MLLSRLIAGDTSVFDAMLSAAGATAPQITLDPTPDGIDRDRLHSLFRYWLGLPRGARLPLTAAIDPLDIGPALSIVMLLETTDAPFEFHYRLYGTEVAYSSKLELTGKTTAAVPSPEMRIFFQVTYAAAVQTGRPVRADHRPPVTFDVTRWSRLVLPCEDGTGRINRLLVGNEPLFTRTRQFGAV